MISQAVLQQSIMCLTVLPWFHSDFGDPDLLADTGQTSLTHVKHFRYVFVKESLLELVCYVDTYKICVLACQQQSLRTKNLP